jgi:hypothetical protein
MASDYSNLTGWSQGLLPCLLAVAEMLIADPQLTSAVPTFSRETPL